MKTLTLFFCLTLTCMLSAQEFDYVDTTTGRKFIVTTQNGAEFIGRIVRNDEKEVVIETAKLGMVTIPKNEVKEIQDAFSETESEFIVTTQSGAEFIGKIIKNDEKEVVIETNKLGKVAIPKYQISEITKLGSKNYNNEGEFRADQVFATRYFGTTNGLSVKKGENYAKISFLGPDVIFSVADNVVIGIQTSWIIGTPLAVTVKYAHQINETNSIGVGVLAGNLGWTSLIPGVPFNLLALPFVAYTKGDRSNNINIALGYGQLWFDGESGGGAIGSIGGIKQVAKRTSFVFDSTILGLLSNSTSSVNGDQGFGFVATPGLRFQQKRMDAAFQFGFSFFGVITPQESLVFPIPLPRFAWFQKF